MNSRITLQSSRSVGRGLQFMVIFSFLFFLEGSNFVLAQVVPDSIKRDSLNKEFLKQSNANKQAVGADTSSNILSASDNPSDSVAAALALKAKKAKRHSPKKAALLSLALPGLGQAYNKKYWKIPIIYAGFGGLGYALYYTATNFYGYRGAYRAHVATNPDPNASYHGVSDAPTLKAYRDYFKNNMDIAAIVTGVWYALNIIDATVDAHLFEWNMKDDLSVSWQPTMINGNLTNTSAAVGLRVNLRF